MEENIRRAILSDMQLLFTWTNDELVRENSFCSSKININTHTKWFEKKLQSTKGDIYIYEINHQPVGQLRLDYEEDKVIIGYSIQRDQRGRGYGSRLLYLAEELAKKHYENMNELSYITLVGRVKYSNVISSKCFLNLGYDAEELDQYMEYSKTITLF